MNYPTYQPEQKEKYPSTEIWLLLFSLACIVLFIFLNFLSALSESGLYIITGATLLSSFVSLVIAIITFIKIEDKVSYLGFLLLEFSWGLLSTIYSLIIFEDLFKFSSLFPFLMLGFAGMGTSFLSLVVTAMNLAKGKERKLNTFTLFFTVPILLLSLGACLSLWFLSGAIG